MAVLAEHSTGESGEVSPSDPLREGDAGHHAELTDRRRYLEITNRHTKTPAPCSAGRPRSRAGVYDLAHLIDEDWLHEAYRHEQVECRGIDGVTAKMYAEYPRQPARLARASTEGR